MKSVKLIGLAAIAALAIAAVLGAGSASAAETALCKVGGTGMSPYCPSSERYPSNTKFSATPKSGTKITISTSLATVECSESTISGSTSAESGEPLPLSVSGWTLGGCTLHSGGACTATAAKSSPYSGSLNRTEESKGTLSIGSGGSGNPGWTVECGSTLQCTYTLEAQFAFNGEPSSAEFTGSKLSLAKSGFLCGKTNTLSATYTVHSPEPARLALPKDPPAETATGLCEAWVYYCEPGDLYPGGTHVEGKGSVVIDFPSGYGYANIECSLSSIGIETAASYGEPALPVKESHLSLYGCYTSSGQGCDSRELQLPDGEVTYIPEVGGNGSWTRSSDQEIWMNCHPLGSWSCTFILPAEAELELVHGEPGKFDLNEVGLESPNGGICPRSATLEGSLPLTSPSGQLTVTNVVR